MKPRDTIVLVIVVPTLAPMIMGTALRIVIELDATSATTTAVVVELLCNMAVTNNPMKRPVNGFAVASKIVSVKFLLRCWSEDVSKSIANKKRSNAPMM